MGAGRNVSAAREAAGAIQRLGFQAEGWGKLEGEVWQAWMQRLSSVWGGTGSVVVGEEEVGEGWVMVRRVPGIAPRGWRGTGP